MQQGSVPGYDLKTIIFLDQYGGVYGGQRILCDLVEYFKSLNYYIIVAAPGQGKLERKIRELCVGFIPLTDKSSKKRMIVLALMVVIRSLQMEVFSLLANTKNIQNKNTLIYCNGLRVLPLALIFGFLKRIPCILHVHLCIESRLIKTTLLLLSVLTKVNVIFVSETARSITLKKFNSERIHVVHNWMIARNISEGKQLLDKKIHAILNENVLRLAYIGRITRSKGVHVLVESLVELKKSKFEFTCVFAGGIGHELNEVKYVESINKCIKENNIDSYVKFVGELEDVNDIYSTAHIVVIPSLCIESFGLVAIEAMAFGCIAMSSEIGGLKEIVKTGETGFLFKPGNASELAESIIYCKNNRSECADIIRCAQKDVENRFNAERQLKMIRTIVDSA